MRRKASLVWIFSFADLAFILVLALAMIPSADNEYAKLKLAKVVKHDKMKGEVSNKKIYRVYVTGAAEKWPIRLEQFDNNNGKWIKDKDIDDIGTFEKALNSLKLTGNQPQFLADDNSQSGAMLLALSLIQKTWPDIDIWTTVKLEQPSF